MFKYIFKSISYLTLCCYLLCAHADLGVVDEKPALVGNWSLQSSTSNHTMETSYYPNGIAKFVVFSKNLSNQVLGYAVANWYLDNDCILHTTFIEQSSEDLKLVTGIEELEHAVIINSNHVRLFSTSSEEVKDLHRLKNSMGVTTE